LAFFVVATSELFELLLDLFMKGFREKLQTSKRASSDELVLELPKYIPLLLQAYISNDCALGGSSARSQQRWSDQ
jgi:hypothetical protein